MKWDSSILSPSLMTCTVSPLSLSPFRSCHHLAPFCPSSSICAAINRCHTFAENPSSLSPSPFLSFGCHFCTAAFRSVRRPLFFLFRFSVSTLLSFSPSFSPAQFWKRPPPLISPSLLLSPSFSLSLLFCRLKSNFILHRGRERGRQTHARMTNRDILP